MMFFLSLFLPIICSYFCLHAFWPSGRVFQIQTAIKLFLAIGLGLGISSLNYWFFLNLSGSFDRSSILVEIIIFIALISLFLTVVLKRKSEKYGLEMFESKPDARDMLSWRTIPFLAIGFWTAVGSAISLFVARTLNFPHGLWDAWAIWNLRARFLFRSQAQWMDAFLNIHSCPHRDYPLLIPASIARIWAYTGTDSFYVPAMVAFLYTFSIVGLVVSSMAFIKNRNQGYVAGLVLLSVHFFTIYGSSQYSDVPLSFFILATIIVFFLKTALPEKSAGFCFLAGLMAGLGSWTKNEGLLFVVVLLFSHFIVTFRQKGWTAYMKEGGALLAGLLPVMLIVVQFKMKVQVPNDLVSNRGLEALVHLLLDWKRYLVVIKAWLYYLNKNYWIVVILIPVMFFLFGSSMDKKYQAAMAISVLAVVLLLSGYFMIYIITPCDIEWHLGSSLSRLYLQVMPGMVFIFFALLKSMVSADPWQR